MKIIGPKIGDDSKSPTKKIVVFGENRIISHGFLDFQGPL